MWGFREATKLKINLLAFAAASVFLGLEWIDSTIWLTVTLGAIVNYTVNRNISNIQHARLNNGEK